MQCRDLSETHYLVGPDETLVDGKVCKVVKKPALVDQAPEPPVQSRTSAADQQSGGLNASVQDANEKGQPGQALTNDAILRLANAGLGEDTIASMVSAQPGKYSLAADDIIALKKAGVPEKVIAAILNKASSKAPQAPAAAPSPEAPEVGVYLRQGNTWAEVMPEVVNWQTGGVIKSHLTVGVVKGDVNGRIEGKSSGNLARTPLDFLFHLPEGVEITEYQLVRLHEHGSSREFRTVTGGVFHQSGGAKRDTLPFGYKKTAPRTYTVSLSDASAGEYGFLAPGAALSSHASAQLGKMYTFHVLE
jgi:hypothetical protein